MSVPAFPSDDRRQLPDCESDLPARHWSSPTPRARLRLVPPPASAIRPAVPPPAVVRLLRQVLEALDGRRPLEQLRPLLTRAVRHDLLARLRDLGTGGRHRLRSVHACRPALEAVEVSAVIDYRPQAGPWLVLAAAVRFEHDGGGQWLCTVLTLL